LADAGCTPEQAKPKLLAPMPEDIDELESVLDELDALDSPFLSPSGSRTRAKG
jgi:hypothetical protein